MAAHGRAESLNGMILLGLTTAFMFSIIQRLSASAHSYR